MNQYMIERFFDTAMERHRIFLRRTEGQQWPWTEDRIFQEGRFCNVYRELDKTTQWFARFIRPLSTNPRKQLLNTVIFRWFNRIETGGALLDEQLFYGEGDVGGGYPGWELQCALSTLDLVRPVVTGAYVIKTPDDMNKLQGVCWCIENFHQFLDNTIGPNMDMYQEQSLENVWRWLCDCAYLGPFMAYEIVSDLQYMSMRDAPDILTWANPGPGAQRGLNRLAQKAPSASMRRELAISAMRHLREHRLARDLEELSGIVVTMREIEHWLCEFDKYERVRHGGRTKQKYRRPE